MPVKRTSRIFNVDEFALIEQIGRKLMAIAWVSDVGYDRQDIWFRWTDEGKSHFADFITDYQLAVPDTNQDEIETIATNIYYLGIKQRTKREQLEHDIDELIQRVDCKEVQITNNQNGEEVTFSITEKNKIVDYIYSNNAVDEMTICGNRVEIN